MGIDLRVCSFSIFFSLLFIRYLAKIPDLPERCPAALKVTVLVTSVCHKEFTLSLSYTGSKQHSQATTLFVI